RQELVDPARVDHVVEVVHPHAALVAQPAVVLEPGGAGHGRKLQRTSSAPKGRPRAPLRSISLDIGTRKEVRAPGGPTPAVPRAVAGGDSPARSSCRVLAASHLRDPRTTISQLDHLLSPVRSV